MMSKEIIGFSESNIHVLFFTSYIVDFLFYTILFYKIVFNFTCQLVIKLIYKNITNYYEKK